VLNGSRLAAGKAAPCELAVVSRAMTKDEAIRCIGGDSYHIERALNPKDSYHAHVELRIEQGGALRDGAGAGVEVGSVWASRKNEAHLGKLPRMTGMRGTLPVPSL